MKEATYSALLKDLQKLQKMLVASQIAAVRNDPTLAAKLQRLHAEAEVGGPFDDFAAMAARESTVLLLLRTVFVRVLEDVGILAVKRLRDDWGFAAFREVAPALGVRAYFAFVFRDLAADFPALFAPGEDELPLPDEDGCRALWNLWHHPNRDGEHYVWNGDGFDSRFLGDLYQDLDADIRKRYALLQTPRFVEEYILDHTLTPALAEFDPEKLRAAGQRFRLLDPTCGSGHFLIGAFHRLADYWRDRHGLTEWAASERALESVWGCDINPHAVDIADFRLLLEVVARTSVKDLERLAELKLNLSAMDSLIPWERGARQAELFPARDRLDGYATQKQRRENAAFLGREFHAVVGNPPYIAPKDVRKRDDYRAFWPVSATGRYALSAPFVERFVVLGTATGFIGQITANSFMKRDFGRKLIEEVLPLWDITGIVETWGADIPGHNGTPTVILLARSQTPQSGRVWAILAKRGRQNKAPDDPPGGPFWRSVESASTQPTDADPYITVTFLERAILAKHPWSLGGGEIQGLLSTVVENADHTLSDATIGNLSKLIQDDVYLGQLGWLYSDPECDALSMLEGKRVRDYSVSEPSRVLFPYRIESPEHPVTLSRESRVLRHFWRFREFLLERQGVGFKTVRSRGQLFYEYPFYFPETTRGLGIAFAFVATHNHFVLERGGRIYHQSAPIIKLGVDASEDQYLDILGLLNSSTLAFWIRQKFRTTGHAEEPWTDFLQIGSKTLRQAPLVRGDAVARISLVKALDAKAQQRALRLPFAVLRVDAWSPQYQSLAAKLSAARDEFAALTEEMVSIQEELDWLTYGSFDVISPIETVGPDNAESLKPGSRPFEIVLARRHDEGLEDDGASWWLGNGHVRSAVIPETCSSRHRVRLQQRMDLIESDARVALLESPPHKRRWETPDWATETKEAAESWLLDSLEALFVPAARLTSPRGPLTEPKPYRLEDITAVWSRDPRVAAVAGVWTGTGLSVDLTLVAEKLLRSHALPDNPLRLYSDEGLRKLTEWKHLWALQDQEDAWDHAADVAKARGEAPPKKILVDPEDPSKVLDAIPLPRKFDKADFAKAEFFSIRGKLNVPRERFILFADLTPNRFGWNGWRDRERALAQVEAFTLSENDPQQPLPVPTSEDPRRCGVTFGLWESLPDVQRWGAAEEHAELQALAREACRQPRCPCPVLEAWKPIVLHSKATERANRIADAAANKANGTGKPKGLKGKAEVAAPPQPTVSLPARAWVASLFQPGKDLDAAGAWSRHRGRLAEPAQTTLPGVGATRAQLTLPDLAIGPPAELVALSQAELALVLDDLVASGDLQASGRGSKKRFQLVPRGVAP